MYLTRFPLNISRRQTKAMISNPYKLHAAIAASFPPGSGTAGSSGRVLWRVDRQSSGGFILYIASPNMPSLVGLDEQVGWPDLDRKWQTRDYGPFLDRLKEGQRWAFRLRANPTVNHSAIRSDSGQSRSKRFGHLTALQQAAWLIGEQAYAGTGKNVPDLFANNQVSRAERHGFHVIEDPASGIPQVAVSDSRTLRFGPKGRHNIALTVAQFDGALEVSDADALRGALIHGIGHGKGFGCGLLTLAPLKRG